MHDPNLAPPTNATYRYLNNAVAALAKIIDIDDLEITVEPEWELTYRTLIEHTTYPRSIDGPQPHEWTERSFESDYGTTRAELDEALANLADDPEVTDVYLALPLNIAATF